MRIWYWSRWPLLQTRVLSPRESLHLFVSMKDFKFDAISILYRSEHQRYSMRNQNDIKDAIPLLSPLVWSWPLLHPQPSASSEQFQNRHWLQESWAACHFQPLWHLWSKPCFMKTSSAWRNGCFVLKMRSSSFLDLQACHGERHDMQNFTEWLVNGRLVELKRCALGLLLRKCRS